MSGYSDIEVPYTTHRTLQCIGLIEWSDGDGTFVLTEKGTKWLGDYCDRRLKEIAESVKPYDFYGGSFSNFAESPISLITQWGTHTYPTVEHFYQAMKATSQQDHNWILDARGPGEAKRRGQRATLRLDWEEAKYGMMMIGLRMKFLRQDYRPLLLATGDREIREDSPTDFIWGYRNNGLNLLGKALMQVRREIREAEADDGA